MGIVEYTFVHVKFCEQSSTECCLGIVCSLECLRSRKFLVLLFVCFNCFINIFVDQQTFVYYVHCSRFVKSVKFSLCITFFVVVSSIMFGLVSY